MFHSALVRICQPSSRGADLSKGGELKFLHREPACMIRTKRLMALTIHQFCTALMEVPYCQCGSAMAVLWQYRAGTHGSSKRENDRAAMSSNACIHTTSCHAMSHHVMSWHVTPHNPRHNTSCLRARPAPALSQASCWGWGVGRLPRSAGPMPGPATAPMACIMAVCMLLSAGTGAVVCST